MLLKPVRHSTSRGTRQGRLALPAGLAVLAILATAQRASAQFSSGSNGSCGAYNPTTSGYFVPANFTSCNRLAYNVFDFTTITIPAGVTITLTAGYDNAPVYWLATGNVDIEGTLSLAGANGAACTQDVDLRLPALAGPGGYAGGVGGYGYSGPQPPTAGSGPGGGLPGANGSWGGGGSFRGVDFLVPLRGGSGGGGADGPSGCFGAGGGAGGGAILIASSTQITIGSNGTGMINANGGAGGACNIDCDNSPDENAGGGSGGGIRLVSNTIAGSGSLTALEGPPSTTCVPGTATYGVVRLEATTMSFTGSFSGTPVYESGPDLPLNIPTVPQPTVWVSSVDGITINANPFSFPDATIDTSSSVPVVVSAQQIPVGTTATLIVLSATADQDTGLSCTLAGTLTSSTCTINVIFPYAGSRGLVTTTWSNSSGSGSGQVKKK